jgi:hypothetical protein
LNSNRLRIFSNQPARSFNTGANEGTQGIHHKTTPSTPIKEADKVNAKAAAQRCRCIEYQRKVFAVSIEDFGPSITFGYTLGTLDRNLGGCCRGSSWLKPNNNIISLLGRRKPSRIQQHIHKQAGIVWRNTNYFRILAAGVARWPKKVRRREKEWEKWQHNRDTSEGKDEGSHAKRKEGKQKGTGQSQEIETE